MKTVLVLVSLAALFSTSALAGKAPEAQDAWVQEAPPGAEVMAGYMRIRNPLGSEEELVSVHAKNFSAAQLHETVMDADHASMRPVTTLHIPAGGEVALAHHGYHLMLIGPKRAFRAGDTIDMELKFASGRVVHVRAPVRAASGHDHMH